MSRVLPKNEVLRERAAMLARVRDFFSHRNILEVDVPALSFQPSVDTHIDLVTVRALGRTGYLHSSPEYGMKKLLSCGVGDIYQLSHVYRDGEMGERHLVEFMMIEWYRCGWSLDQLIDETARLVELFVGLVPRQQLSYREALRRYAGVDYLTDPEELLAEALPIDPPTLDRRDLLTLLLGLRVEPALPANELVIITNFPANQAALAQTQWLGEEHVAERFEIFYGGMELANGYHELADPNEQRRRFVEANRERMLLGKGGYPVDEAFIESLAHLPDCCGVAVGFDRLMMIRQGATQIQEITIASL